MVGDMHRQFPDHACLLNPKPATLQSCGNDSCTPEWFTSKWGKVHRNYFFLPDNDSLSICNSFVCVWIEDKDTGITEAEDIIFCKISETIISFTQPRETSAFVVPLKKFGKRRLTRALHACSCRSLIIFPHYDANCFISLFIFAVLQVMWWR